MPRIIDPVWGYATRDNKNKRFKCNFCQISFSGAIAIRFKHHLAQEPHGNIRKCERVPSDVKAECLRWMHESNSISSGKGTKIPATASSEEHDDGKMKLQMSIIRFFKSHELPLKLVEDPKFVQMFCSIKHYGLTSLPSKEELDEVEFLMDSDDDDDDDWD